MAAEFPTERRFWFAPTFHSGQSALMHRQPDDVWRVDLQLGPDADPVAEQEPQRVRARLDKVLAPHAYELEWVSIYTFNCRRPDRFVHDRVVFVGSARAAPIPESRTRRIWPGSSRRCSKGRAVTP